MSDIRGLLIESAEKIFSDHVTPEVILASEQGRFPEDLWAAVEEAGLPRAAVPEAQGGAGATLGDALSVLSVAGRHAAPIPLAETILAGWALSAAGFSVPAGPLTVAPLGLSERIAIKAGTGGGFILDGTADPAPWAGRATFVAVLASGASGEQRVACVKSADIHKVCAGNLAGEPRERITFSGVQVAANAVAPAPAGVDVEGVRLLGALARSLQMAGALERAFDHTVRYTSERVQFGRALSQFQAVQQQIALMGGDVVAARVAADVALDAIDAVGPSNPRAARREIASAKVRAGLAIPSVVPPAHQLHGAMGFTQEYALHHATRRLWAWRDEFGTEDEWAARLATGVLNDGAATVWTYITGAAGTASAV